MKIRPGYAAAVCAIAVCASTGIGVSAGSTSLPAEIRNGLIQEKPAPAPQVALRVTVVISRLQGDKKVGNLPFTLTLNSNERTSLRMGADVPIPQPNTKEGTSFTYRPVGTQIDCNASPVQGDGRVKLQLTVTDSQVSVDNSPEPNPMRGLPRFQNFTSTATLTLRDAQTMEYTAATDKVTGEVVRVSVLLNVIK
jgi:Flp pilus assembly secretin CpaC